MLVELLRHKSKIPFDYYKEVLLIFRDIVYDLDIRMIQDFIEMVHLMSRDVNWQGEDVKSGYHE